MKLVLLLVLAILPMLVIPAYAELQLSFEYGINVAGVGKTIIINVIGAQQTVDLEIIADDGEIIQTLSFDPSNQGEITLPWILSKDIEYGIYTVTAFDQINYAEAYFYYYDDDVIYILPDFIKLQIDKENYYQNDLVYVNGNIIEIDWSEDITIHYDIIHNSITSDITQLNNDGTFDFIIDTNLWNYDGKVQVTVNIQNYTSSIFFNYFDVPNTANESLYNYITDNNNDILSHENTMIEYNTHLINQNNTINAHDTMLNNHNTTMYGYENTITILQDKITLLEQSIINILAILNAPPIPSDAVQIISFTANDPDDLDVIFSIDDTILVTFDSNTNTPGGNGPQTKQEVNNLFTFSNIIGQAYNGKWVTPDSFLITIKGINTSTLIIGNTTVVPAGITPIYPADNTPDASILESPVLTGDWGE